MPLPLLLSGQLKHLPGNLHMKTLLVIGLFIISSSAFSAVYKSYDSNQSCNLYRVVNTDQAQENEVVVYSKNVYGISFENLEVDFENRQAQVQVMLNVTLGLNRSLLTTKASISADNVNFTDLINHLNRKIKIFENICITDDNQIIYANEFKAE
jgi:hypothetical protein